MKDHKNLSLLKEKSPLFQLQHLIGKIIHKHKSELSQVLDNVVTPWILQANHQWAPSPSRQIHLILLPQHHLQDEGLGSWAGYWQQSGLYWLTNDCSACRAVLITHCSALSYQGITEGHNSASQHIPPSMHLPANQHAHGFSVQKAHSKAAFTFILEESGEWKAVLPGHTLSHFPFIPFNEYPCSFLSPFYQQKRVLLCQICLRANGVAVNL